MSLPVSMLTSFSMTQPELLFILRLLELPDLPGMGEKPWGEISLEVAQAQFHEAGLALKARGWIKVDENKIATILPELHLALSISAYPDQMMRFVYQNSDGKSFDICHYSQKNLCVRHVQTTSLLHEFNLFEKADMGLQELLNIFDKYHWSTNIASFIIPADVYEKSLHLARENSLDAEKILISVGVDAENAKNLTQTFINYEIKAYVQWVYELNPNLKLSSLFVWGTKDFCWVAETSLQVQNKQVKILALSNEFFTRLLTSGQQGIISN